MNETRILFRFQYYLEDMNCTHCLYYQGKKQGCVLDICCCEEEKQAAIANSRIKREGRTTRWDM